MTYLTSNESIGHVTAEGVLRVAHAQPARDCVYFAASNTEILRLTKDGMYYKGEYVADAGAAHKAFMETMAALQAVQPSVVLPSPAQ